MSPVSCTSLMCTLCLRKGVSFLHRVLGLTPDSPPLTVPCHCASCPRNPKTEQGYSQLGRREWLNIFRQNMFCISNEHHGSYGETLWESRNLSMLQVKQKTDSKYPVG